VRIFRRNCSGIVAIIGTAAEAEVVTAGVASLGGTPMPSDAIMRIQSMTKVTIAVAALRLIERGELGLDQPVDQEHLCANIFGPLGLADTALWVPIDKIDRLPAAHRHGPDGFVEAEPAAGGFYAGPALRRRSRRTGLDGARLLPLPSRTRRRHRADLGRAHTRARHRSGAAPSKTADSFFPGFGTAWAGIRSGGTTGGRHQGRYGWSGGLGTDYFVDPDGTVAVLFTQDELGGQLWPLIADFQELSPLSTRP
jgi:CubicO group peptidase (beta-lactamase class C family)